MRAMPKATGKCTSVRETLVLLVADTWDTMVENDATYSRSKARWPPLVPSRAPSTLPGSRQGRLLSKESLSKESQGVHAKLSIHSAMLNFMICSIVELQMQVVFSFASCMNSKSNIMWSCMATHIRNCACGSLHLCAHTRACTWTWTTAYRYMYIYTYIYIYTGVSTHLNTYAVRINTTYTYVHAYDIAHRPLYASTSTITCVCTPSHVCMWLSLCRVISLYMYRHKRMKTHIYMQVHTHVYTCMYLFVYIYICIYVYVSIGLCVYRCVYIFI